MNSLESIRSLIIEFIKASANITDYENVLLRSGEICEKHFQQKVYSAFYNLIADPTQSPENIIIMIDIYTSGLDGFSRNLYMQAVVAFACFEALAIRRPKVLSGPWEALVWVLIKYSSHSSFASTLYGKRITSFKKTNLATVKFIIEFGSCELCPNPYLRLEIFRLMRCFNCLDLLKKLYECETYCDNCRDWFKEYYYCESYCDMIISTLIDLSENYTPFTLDEVPIFSPVDLEFIMQNNSINMRYIMKDSKLEKEKSKIIVAILKLIRNFALLEKEKHNQRYNNLSIYWFQREGMDEQVSSCLSLCGLLSPSKTDNYDQDVCALNLVQAVENDSFLLNYLIDTLEIINDLILSIHRNKQFRWSAYHKKDNLLHRLFKNHNKQFYKYQNILEINGGFTPVEKYRLRRLQCNGRDHHNPHDSDYDSESGLY